MLKLLIKLAAFVSVLHLSSGAPTVNNNQLADNDFLGLNRYDLPNFSSTASDVDIEKTVDQVQQILNLNPNLPRLSKDDILSLLNNITSEDKLKANKQAEAFVGAYIENDKEVPKNKDRNKNKMTMVVLPYNTEDTSNGDVTELFTKAPKITYEPPKESFPIIVPDMEDEDDVSAQDDKNESLFKNHKYSDSNASKKAVDNATSPDAFWKNQAHKVMEDLEKQNQPNKIVLEIPFKKMPDVEIPLDYNKNNEITNEFETVDLESINKLLGEPKDDATLIDANKPFKPLALYEFKSLPEPVTNFELIYPKEDKQESLVAHSSSSFVDDKSKLQHLFTPNEVSADGQKKGEYSISPKVDAAAYTSFKPLPTKESSNGEKTVDLDEILQQYGIYDYIDKTYLPVNNSETSPDFGKDVDFIEPDVLPASMASMLTDMGLTKKKGRNMNDEESNVDMKYGINPMDDEEMKGLYESLNMIKRQMDEGSTEAHVKEVKNESKNKVSEDNDSESSSETETIDTNSKDSDKGPSLAALEESFGASPADKDPSEAVLPPPRRNGFYYMVDWNSFLEVEGTNRKINIRFEPKLGDPQMFLFGKRE